MTISSNNRKAGPFIGNGSAATFPFTFKVFQASDLFVVRLTVSTGAQSTLVLGTDYTVTLNLEQDSNPGGSITLVAGALASGYNLIITSDIGNLQPTDLTNQGGFYPEVINDSLDRATIQIQQLQEQTDRTLKYPVTDPSTGTELPAVAQRAGKVLTFDELGAPIAGPSVDEVGTILNNLANITTVANDLNGPDTIGTVATNIADVNTVASNMADVNTVADNIADVGTVATNIADVIIAADNVADINNFADVYQGAKASDPTLRNNGSPLQPGDMYFNTSVNELRLYSGSVWVAGTAGTVAVQRFSGTGSQTAFTLTTAPSGENNTQVYINGVYQQKDTYGVTGTTLTFSTAPPAGTDNIEVVTISTLALGETDASLVTFSPAGDGAVERTVQAKLRETVSVKDFGAVGDGVTDDTAAIQAALDSSNFNTIYFPIGTYRVTSTLTVTYLSPIDNLNHSSVNITGAGKGSKIYWDGANNSPVIWYKGQVGTLGGAYSQTFIEKIQIITAYSATGKGITGILIGDPANEPSAGVGNVTIRNCTMYYMDYCVRSFWESDEIWIENNLFRSYYQVAIDNQGGSGYNICKNHIQDGYANSIGIRSEYTAVTIKNNVIQGTGIRGIYLNGCSGFSISDNYTESLTNPVTYFIGCFGASNGYIGQNNIGAYIGADLIYIDSACNNITIGSNSHSQSGGIINSLVNVIAGATKIIISAPQNTDGSITSILGTPLINTTSALITNRATENTFTGGVNALIFRSLADGNLVLPSWSTYNLFTMSAGEAYIVTAQQETDDYVAVALVTATSAATSSVVTIQYATDAAKFTIDNNGLTIRAKNLLSGNKTLSYSAIRVK